jgi:hypothetical protein
LIYTTTCKKVKEEKVSEKYIRSMKIEGVHEVRERLLREGISIGEVTPLTVMSKEEKEKDRKRNIISMKTGGAAPWRDTLCH